MAISVGDEAPDFALKGPDGELVKLSDYRGKKNVVIVFFPLAFSGICTMQLTDIGSHEAQYAGSDAQVLGISVDSHHTQAAFAKSLGLRNTLLLSDFHPRGEVAQRYGVYMDELGMSMRASFVVDRNGIVRHADVRVPKEVPDEAAYFTTLAACNIES
jgi:peroxiredoxin